MVHDPLAAAAAEVEEEGDAREASVSAHSMGSSPAKLRRAPSSRNPISGVSIAALFSDHQAPGPGADAVAAQLANSLKVGGWSWGVHWPGGQVSTTCSRAAQLY